MVGYIRIPGEPLAGVILPRDAVVRAEGAGWVYVLNSAGEAFTRIPIALDHPTEAGWFVTKGVTAGENVVVAGAQQLLSLELKSAGGEDGSERQITDAHATAMPCSTSHSSPMLRPSSISPKVSRVVVALACVLLGYGIHVARNAKLDVFPNFVQPQVVIQTECPGLAPEQVELLVTLPIESTVNGLGDMESLRSESIEGLSIITAVFKEGTDVFRARQMLAEQLAETAGELPTSVKPPRMTPLTSSTMDLLKIGLVSDKLTPMELRTFADWTLKPRLLSVPGVAKCSVFGGEVRQLQIQVLPDRLMAYDLALSDVLAAARVSTGVMGAGFVETRNQRITLQTEGQALTPEILGEVVVAHTNGLSVRLKDVARVVEGAEPKFGDTVVMGRWGVLMTMSSQYGANTMEVTKRLEAALDEMKPVFEQEGIRVYARLHRPATFIEAALRNMKHSLALGGILVAVVLFLLLGSVRTACISLTAIPLSLLTAVIVLEKFGITINTITLGGLAIALGEVVDDSIIDVENIFRRLRENKDRWRSRARYFRSCSMPRWRCAARWCMPRSSSR